MDPQQLLSQLKDVHSPESISSWPPAVGWWILGLIIIASIIALVHWFVAYKRANAWRKAARMELNKLAREHSESPSDQSIRGIIILLKQCIASAKGTKDCYALTGENWKSTLQNTFGPLSDEDLFCLTEGHYQAKVSKLSNATFTQLQNRIKVLGK